MNFNQHGKNMKKNTIDKKKRIYLILFLLSNLTVYMMCSTESSSLSQVKRSQHIHRPDYVYFKINAQLKTFFSYGSPISIINKKQNLHIPYALLISEKSPSKKIPSFDAEDGLLKSSTPQLTIYIHKQYIPQLLNSKELIVIPHTNEKFKTTRRKSYEIIF